MVDHSAGVTTDLVAKGRWEIEVCDRRIPATASLKPLYDPKSDRVRA